MRLPTDRHECGPLWDLGWIRRELRLLPPISEGSRTIEVARVVGSVSRTHDFDGCWHPRERRLARRLREVERAAPTMLDEPIEVVRLDRAYFVVDGHKRVAIAWRTGREFIDARVSRLPTPYELSTDLDEATILRTAREAEFRRHSGMASAVPAARFALTEIDAYGELFAAVRSHAMDLSEREERLLPMAAAAADWYTGVYLPTVEGARETAAGLLDTCTDADVYLAMRRQQLGAWGTACDAASCAADQLVARRRLAARRRSPVARLLAREPGPDSPMLLPLGGDRG